MIYINDKEYSYSEAKTLAALFESLNIAVGKGVAVAVNSSVVPKTLWSEYTVNDNDRIILIKATQGG